MLDLRSQNSIDFHKKESKKRGNRKKLGDKEYKLSDFDFRKNEILEEIKNVMYNDLEDLVYRFQLTYDEIIDFLDLKYVPTKRTGCSLNLGVYEASEMSKTLEFILPIMWKCLLQMIILV